VLLPSTNQAPIVLLLLLMLLLLQLRSVVLCAIILYNEIY